MRRVRERRKHAEAVEDRERVVGEKLAAEFVARKGVAIVERDAGTASCEQRRERGAGRTGTDDRDVYFHSSSPKRNGHLRTTRAFAAPCTFLATSRASGSV